MTVLAGTQWKSNAELIVDCVELGYFKDQLTLDPTYNRGIWWTKWRPAGLVAHTREKDGTDFRKLHYFDDSFPQIAFDPPYVCKGGRSTSGMTEFDDRFGLADAPRTPTELQQLIDDGMTEMFRLIQPRGVVLVKCQNYVSSGRLWPGVFKTTQHALSLGFQVVDELYHVGHVRPQPARTRADGKPVRQQHARQNVSVLIVLRAPRRK